MKQNLIHGVIIALISFILCEIVLRLYNYHPMVIQKYSIESSPNQNLLPHFSLGFVLNTGVFKTTINHHVHYENTHGIDSLRITQRAILPQNTNQNQKIIDFHGCSFTYGMGVNDSLTFPFLLQGAFPHLLIRNQACPGYGTIQALLKLKQQLKNGTPPDILLLSYAGFHDDRNALSVRYRTNLKLGFLNSTSSIRPLFEKSNLPYMTKDGIIKYERWADLYENWIGRTYFSTVNTIQSALEESEYDRNLNRKITLKIIKEIDTLCKAYQIQLGIVILTNHYLNYQMSDFANENQIPLLDASLPIPSESYSQLPYDIHPNAKAHRIFAEQLYTFFKKGGL